MMVVLNFLKNVEFKLKKYESKVVKVYSNGDALIDLPEELCIELGWNVGDTLTFSVENDTIILKKNDGFKSTN
jgi:bifunctional DNA-binding transcriptional regulator/antitoxin component of YhaV-PrlF toxin-antitoxin module